MTNKYNLSHSSNHIDKYYIIQSNKNKSIKKGMTNTPIVNWIANNPCKSISCIDHFINLAKKNPHGIFYNENPITINFIGKVHDIIDIIRHALRKNYFSIVVYRASHITDMIKNIHVKMEENKCIYKLHQSINYIDACVIFNKNHFFSKLLNVLSNVSTNFELNRLINNNLIEQYPCQNHLFDQPRNLQICLENVPTTNLPT
tara:strand:+ start:5113 stop:5718 length:606 start_codon:yes stop_codon:yes gene_type:complete